MNNQVSNTDSDEPLNMALIKSLDKFRLSKFIGFDTTFVPRFSQGYNF